MVQFCHVVALKVVCCLALQAALCLVAFDPVVVWLGGAYLSFQLANL